MCARVAANIGEATRAILRGPPAPRRASHPGFGPLGSTPSDHAPKRRRAPSPRGGESGTPRRTYLRDTRRSLPGHRGVCAATAGRARQLRELQGTPRHLRWDEGYVTRYWFRFGSARPHPLLPPRGRKLIPPDLFPTLFLRGLAESFRAAIDGCRAQNAASKLTSSTRDSAHYRVHWDR